MEKERSFVEELEEKISFFDTSFEKVQFLSNFLDNHKNLPHESLAAVYFLLAEIYSANKNSKVELYKKAAKEWEMAAIAEYKDDNFYRRLAFKNALKSYKPALALYKKSERFADAQEIGSKISEIKEELKNYDGYIRNVGMIVVLSIFLLSLILLSFPITGFAVSPLEEEQTMNVGTILVFFAIAGAIFILSRWR